jgi:hypothetical protein
MTAQMNFAMGILDTFEERKRMQFEAEQRAAQTRASVDVYEQKRMLDLEYNRKGFEQQQELNRIAAAEEAETRNIARETIPVAEATGAMGALTSAAFPVVGSTMMGGAQQAMSGAMQVVADERALQTKMFQDQQKIAREERMAGLEEQKTRAEIRSENALAAQREEKVITERTERGEPNISKEVKTRTTLGKWRYTVSDTVLAGDLPALGEKDIPHPAMATLIDYSRNFPKGSRKSQIIGGIMGMRKQDFVLQRKRLSVVEQLKRRGKEKGLDLTENMVIGLANDFSNNIIKPGMEKLHDDEMFMKMLANYSQVDDSIFNHRKKMYDLLNQDTDLVKLITLGVANEPTDKDAGY